MHNTKPILLVEDDLVDSMTVRRAIRELNIHNQLITVGNGEEALEYLLDETNQQPCLILLDINMPKMNGLELLEITKNHPILKTIPTIILTTSREELDEKTSFKLGVAGYIVKPVNYSHFVETVRRIDSYWTLSECLA